MLLLTSFLLIFVLTGNAQAQSQLQNEIDDLKKRVDALENQRPQDGQPGRYGPPGPVGPSGPSGPAGFPGVRGPPGACPPSCLPRTPGTGGYPSQGVAHGTKGERGYPGTPGAPGRPGYCSCNGNREGSGIPGPAGGNVDLIRGPPGIPGPRGFPGPQGVCSCPPGVGGSDATRIPDRRGSNPGPVGPRGPSGPMGPRGFPGFPGTPGRSGYPGRPGRAGTCPADCAGTKGPSEVVEQVPCNATELSFVNWMRNGATYKAKCPQYCNPITTPIHGCNPYKMGSVVCAAAKEQGVLMGGEFRLMVTKLSYFSGCVKNGVRSDEMSLKFEYPAFTISKQ